MIDYDKQNKEVQIGTRKVRAGYDTGLHIGPLVMLAATTAAGAAKDLAKKRGSSTSDSEAAMAAAGDGGIANATQINAQRDAILASPVWRDYVSKGLVSSAEIAQITPPAADAFGNAVEALDRIAATIAVMKRVTASDPLYQKWRGNFPADPLGPALGPGNVPEAMTRFQNIWKQIAQWEGVEYNRLIQANNAASTTAPVATTGGQAAPTVNVGGNAGTQPLVYSQSPISSPYTYPAPTAQVQPYAGVQYPTVPTAPVGAPIAAGAPVNTGYAAPAAASALGGNVGKIAAIASGVLMLGFLLSMARGPMPARSSR